VAVVASALPDLSEPLGIELSYRMGDGAVAGAMLEVRHRVVIHIPAIGKDADGDHGRHVGQVPVGPAVIDLRSASRSSAARV
jgi:hypothetical protein